MGNEKFDLNEVSTVFKGYFKGQALMALILACLYSLGLNLTDLRFGFVIGLITGFCAFVPYLGAVVGLILCALSFFIFSDPSWTLALSVLGVFAVIQILEGAVIAPRVFGKQLGLSYFETLAAFIITGFLLVPFVGPFAIILALPGAALVKSFLKKNRNQKGPKESVVVNAKSIDDIKNVTPEKPE